jgi:hypothetical protein
MVEICLKTQCFEFIIKDPDHPLLGIYYEKTNIPQEEPETVARSVMIRTYLWKLILRDAGKEELYDLKYDPKELINLIEIDGYKKVKFDFKEKALRWYLHTSKSPHWKKSTFNLKKNKNQISLVIKKEPFIKKK